VEGLKIEQYLEVGLELISRKRRERIEQFSRAERIRLALEELGPDAFDIVTPSVSILAEPPIALVDVNVDTNGARDLAQGYLDYLYSDVGQSIAAKHYFRPSQPEFAALEDLERFAELNLVTIEEFGGWRDAQARFFGDGGIFDQIYAN